MEKLLQDNGNIKLVLPKVSNVVIICGLPDISYKESVKILTVMLISNLNLSLEIGMDLDVTLISLLLKLELKVDLIT